VPYESSFGELATERANRAPGGPDTPFRIAVLADFSGRQGREAAASPGEVAGRKPIKVNHGSLDEAIESLSPWLEYSVAGGDVAVSLEFTEFDDFQPDPVVRQVDRVTDLDDDGATAVLREILHHPQYQALESAWRGLDWLLRRVQKADKIQVVLFDVTAEEMAADLMSGDDLSQTALFRQLIATTAEGTDNQPWTAIVGSYTFDETTEHAELLGRMAKIAARAGAPFLAGITSRAAQEGYEVPADGKPAWQALRAIPDASYLGLSVPGFLLRPPFGESYRRADAFRFEEFSGAADGYLWGNPGFACAGALALGYMKSGWGFQPSGALALDNMPMHSYRDADGEPVAVTAEVRFTSSTSQEVGTRGFMPLLAVRGRDSVELASIRSVALENPTLSGRWQGGQGGPPETRGVPKVSVGMMSKGESSGRAAPRRDGAAFVSAETEEATAEALAEDAAPAESGEAELDPELAALLAGDSAPAAAAEEAAPELDPELAALLAGDSSTPAPTEEAAPELDPELAALLGEAPAESASETQEESPAEELDPELAALLGETPSPPSDEPSEESPPESPAEEALDPELAALLGESRAGAEEELAADEPAEAETESPMEEAALTGSALADTTSGNGAELDPELAALLGESVPAEPEAETSEEAEAPADEVAESAAADLDPELAALIGNSAPESEPAASDEFAEAASVEQTPDEVDEPATASPDYEFPTPEPEPEPTVDMATVTEDRTEIETDEELSASPATRSASAMAQDLDSLIEQVQKTSNYGGPGSGAPPLVDFKSLLAPISEDERAGGGVPFDVRERLEQARKEVNPDAFAPDDPLRPADFIKADWAGIIALCQETLRNTSKNLLVAARLVEALTKKHGFVGLRDGFHLLRLLVDTCWDRLDPPLEDEDMEVRAGPFNWLDDPDRGAVFPNTIRTVPVLAADGNQFCWNDWQQSQAGGEKQEMIDKVILAAPRDRCQAVVDNLTQAQQELRFLMQSLSEKMGPDAPGFTVVRPAISDCLKLAQGILQKKGPAGAPEESTGTELAVSDGAGQTVGVSKPRMSTREDIYQELATAAAALERLEPHSPVPFLVRRAVELGALPFPLLMQELIRDANVLAEMNRELGIKQRQESGEGSY
jgi:type VI secretion system ImpA family protein